MKKLIEYFANDNDITQGRIFEIEASFLSNCQFPGIKDHYSETSKIMRNSNSKINNKSIDEKKKS